METFDLLAFARGFARENFELFLIPWEPMEIASGIAECWAADPAAWMTHESWVMTSIAAIMKSC